MSASDFRLLIADFGHHSSLKTTFIMNKSYFLLAGLVIAMSSCHYVNGRHISGSGTTGTEQRSITGFTGVETRGSIDIIVSQGSYNVKVETDQNLLQYVETNVENGHLIVRFRQGVSIGNYHSAKVYVTAPELNAFETHGSGNINGQGKIADKNKMDVDISGSGDIELSLDCPLIKTETHGSGNITLDGETKSISCGISGSGDVRAANLKSETVKVSVHGSGDVQVYASESLDAEISGSGDVHYKGAPRISTSVHGSGSVTKMD
jgi:Putative auto-transporter adhesin, head GIN domain